MVKRVFLMLSLIIAASISVLAQAAHPVEGAFSVAATGAEIGTVNFVLKLIKKGDVWSGEIVESPIPMTIKTVTVGADNKVTILASTGDAEVTIAGMLDGPKLGGDWTAGQAKGTWTATRKEAVEAVAAGAVAPAAAAGATGAAPAAAAALEGTYDAEVTAEGQGSLPFVLVIKKAGDKLVTEVPNAGDLNIVGIDINGKDVTLNATFQGNPFPLKGTTDGSKMGGKWEAGGFSGTWSAKKK
jgi:hypothetical protein